LGTRVISFISHSNTLHSSTKFWLSAKAKLTVWDGEYHLLWVVVSVVIKKIRLRTSASH